MNLQSILLCFIQCNFHKPYIMDTLLLLLDNKFMLLPWNPHKSCSLYFHGNEFLPLFIDFPLVFMGVIHGIQTHENLLVTCSRDGYISLPQHFITY